MTWNKFEWTFDENSCQFCYNLFPQKFLPTKSKKRINFNCILFEVNIFVKKLEKQYLKKWEKQMRNDQQSEYKNAVICYKDRIFFFPWRSFSPKIFYLCLHSPLCQALLIKLEHIFSSFSTRVPPLWVSVLILAPL